MGLVATTWVPMGAQVPVLSPNDHPNPSEGQQKGFKKIGNVKNFQVSLNSLRNSIALGKSTSQRIYPKQHTPKIGKNYINTA